MTEEIKSISDFINRAAKLEKNNPFNKLFNNMKVIGEYDGKKVFGYFPPSKRTLEEKKHKYIIKSGSVLHYFNDASDIQRRFNLNEYAIKKLRNEGRYNEYEVSRWNNRERDIASKFIERDFVGMPYNMEVSEEEPLETNTKNKEQKNSKPILGVLENDADITLVLTEINKQPKELTYQHAITISDDEKIDKELKNQMSHNVCIGTLSGSQN